MGGDRDGMEISDGAKPGVLYRRAEYEERIRYLLDELRQVQVGNIALIAPKITDFDIFCLLGGIDITIKQAKDKPQNWKSALNLVRASADLLFALRAMGEMEDAVEEGEEE